MQNPFDSINNMVLSRENLRGLHDYAKTTTYRNMTSFISEKDDMVYQGLYYHSFQNMLH